MTRVFSAADDAVVLELEDLERAILDDLAQQVIGLLEQDDAPPSDPLAAMVGIGTETEPPDDPALARLLPDGFTDDPAASAEFRRFTEVGLRQRKVADAREVRRGLEGASPLRLDAEQFHDRDQTLGPGGSPTRNDELPHHGDQQAPARLGSGRSVAVGAQHRGQHRGDRSSR